MKGSTDFNEVGVQNYRSVTQGVRASAETLSGGASRTDTGRSSMRFMVAPAP